MAEATEPVDESPGRAAAINDLLIQIGLSSTEQTRWWNHARHDELGGRTPTRAWLEGDRASVEALVRRWYEASERGAERAADDAAFVTHLRNEIARLDDRAVRRSLPNAG